MHKILKTILKIERNDRKNLKKDDWGYGALQKIKAGVIQKHTTTLYKTKKMNYEYDTRHLQKRKNDNTNELLCNDMILKRI